MRYNFLSEALLCVKQVSALITDINAIQGRRFNAVQWWGYKRNSKSVLLQMLVVLHHMDGYVTFGDCKWWLYSTTSLLFMYLFISFIQGEFTGTVKSIQAVKAGGALSHLRKALERQHLSWSAERTLWTQILVTDQVIERECVFNHYYGR